MNTHGRENNTRTPTDGSGRGGVFKGDNWGRQWVTPINWSLRFHLRVVNGNPSPNFKSGNSLWIKNDWENWKADLRIPDFQTTFLRKVNFRSSFDACKKHMRWPWAKRQVLSCWNNIRFRTKTWAHASISLPWLLFSTGVFTPATNFRALQDNAHLFCRGQSLWETRSCKKGFNNKVSLEKCAGGSRFIRTRLDQSWEFIAISILFFCTPNSKFCWSKYFLPGFG